MENYIEIKTIKILITAIFFFFFLEAFSPEITFIQKFDVPTHYHRAELINPVSTAMVMSFLIISNDYLSINPLGLPLWETGGLQLNGIQSCH